MLVLPALIELRGIHVQAEAQTCHGGDDERHEQHDDGDLQEGGGVVEARKPPGPEQQYPAEQQQPGECVVVQDVAREQEDDVQDADGIQHEHAPGEPGDERAACLLRADEHHGKAHAEQQGEDLVELAFDETTDQPAHGVVEAGERLVKTTEVFDASVEPLDVHQQDADESDAAQDIHDVQPFGRSDRGEGGPVGGGQVRRGPVSRKYSRSCLVPAPRRACRQPLRRFYNLRLWLARSGEAKGLIS